MGFKPTERKPGDYLEIAPATADRKPWEKVLPLLTNEQWTIEEKLDGWRFLMHFGADLDRTYMTGRRPSKTQGGRLSEKGLCAPCLHPKPAWKDKLGYTVLDGEVMPPDGRSFGDLAGIMNVDPADAERRIKEIGEPEYHIFDVLFYEGVDLRGYPQSMRKRRAHEIAERIFKRNDRVWVVADHADDKEKMYDQWVAEGGEGGILKDQDAPYGSGWVKVKRFATLDTIVTGYTDAEHGVTGKYVGLIGAVKVSVWKDGKLVEIGQVSGMTDADRIAFTKRKSAFLGSVMEIRAQELAKDRLRHPRFARMRPDMSKNSLTCTWKKMMEDLKAGAGR